MTFDRRIPTWAIIVVIVLVPGGTLLAPLLLLSRQSPLAAGRPQ
jgi:hypothetical protein